MKRDDHATEITAERLRRWALPAPSGHRGKEERGAVLVVGGSAEIPGAAVLAGVAALRAGAGKLAIATSEPGAQTVAAAVPEARVLALPADVRGEVSLHGVARVDDVVDCSGAVLLGPGMCDGSACEAVLRATSSRGSATPFVLDAAAIQALPATSEPRGFPVIVTPHAGEMAKLRGVDIEEVRRAPLPIAREAARELGVFVVAKGAITYVVAPDGEAFVNRDAGCAGLGTSGSGDVLGGVLAGLVARGATPMQAACWAVFLHASAGDALAQRMGSLGFLARELPGEIPALLERFR